LGRTFGGDDDDDVWSAVCGVDGSRMVVWVILVVLVVLVGV
jgi:hypothetical protein